MAEQSAGASELPRTKPLHALLKKRKPINHSNVPFILCWSQKAGCTAALKWYLHHAGLLEEALQLHDPNRRLKIHSYENRVLKARAGYTNDMAKAIQQGKPMLGFMRCPYERAFSSYMILNNGWYLRMSKRGVINPGMKIRQSVVDFVHGAKAELNRPVTFQDYLLWLKQQDIATLNPHHTPQRTELHRRFRVTFYRLEDFDTAVTHVEEQYSLNQSWSEREQFSSGHHRAKTSTSSSAALAFLYEPLPLDVFPLENLPKISRDTLGETALGELIEELFAEDIAAYASIPVISPSTPN